ncbi:hypothetical protein AcW2_005101 [Taiwanofungus camphoratus]|nr:hypothetical protein AcW2_005101 [Antrodia cinnamomea]
MMVTIMTTKAEIERTSLLLSICGPKLLERRGLALGGLGIASANVGLGGKTLRFSRVGTIGSIPFEPTIPSSHVPPR